MAFALQLTAGIILSVWLAAALDALRGRRNLRKLQPEAVTGAQPAVSIIVPARNEAVALPHALPSLLAQTHPDLEVIVLDDRSTDGTAAILAGYRSPRLTALRIDAVPSGWLGKNHALYAGAWRARGEWLLFTDADVVFHPRCVEVAVAHAESRGLDHLVLTPRLETHGFWEPALVGCFGLLFGLALRPWRAGAPGSRAFVGIGAFNLLRREVYERIGTHAALRAAVVDDLALGRRVKAHGFRQEAARGEALLHVRWQVGLRGVVTGLEKNGFAGLDYSLVRTAVVCLGLGLLLVAPALAILSGQGGLWLPAALVPITVQAAHARDSRLPVWSALFQPAAALILIYAVLRSAALVLRRGGVEWRGTFYQAADLAATDPSPVPHSQEGERSCAHMPRE
jgi:GT2 family glycosyltransferase